MSRSSSLSLVDRLSCELWPIFFLAQVPDADLFQFPDFCHVLQFAAELPAIVHTLGIRHQPPAQAGHSEFLSSILVDRHSAMAEDMFPFLLQTDVWNNDTRSQESSSLPKDPGVVHSGPSDHQTADSGFLNSASDICHRT